MIHPERLEVFSARRISIIFHEVYLATKHKAAPADNLLPHLKNRDRKLADQIWLRVMPGNYSASRPSSAVETSTKTMNTIV